VFEDNLAELINTIIPDIYKLFRQNKVINAEEMIIEEINAYITVGGSSKKKTSYSNLSRVCNLLAWWLIIRLNKICSKSLYFLKRYSSWSNQWCKQMMTVIETSKRKELLKKRENVFNLLRKQSYKFSMRWSSSNLSSKTKLKRILSWTNNMSIMLNIFTDW